MSLGLRLSLLLWIAGCAGELLIVPNSDWEIVPAAQRAVLDRQDAADLAGARAELAAARTGMAALRTAPPARVAAPRPAPPPASPDDDAWAVELRAREQAGAEARVRVEDAAAAWQHADVSWRRLQLDAAEARVAMVVCARELARARAIDRNLLGSDTYEVAPLRGQFSRAQVRWYHAAAAARDARNTLATAGIKLASVKDAYAQLVRDMPLRDVGSEVPAPAPVSTAAVAAKPSQPAATSKPAATAAAKPVEAGKAAPTKPATTAAAATAKPSLSAAAAAPAAPPTAAAAKPVEATGNKPAAPGKPTAAARPAPSTAGKPAAPASAAKTVEPPSGPPR